VFTTNLGIIVPDENGRPVENVTADNELPEIEERVRGQIEFFFRHGLGRPELFNRVQQNIVVFDFLREEIGDQLYVANTDAIIRFPYTSGATSITVQSTKLVDLPAFPLDHHWTKNIIASKDGTKLYATVGSNSNIAENGFDLEFIEQMIPHHEGAVTMARDVLARDDVHPELRTLAENIVRSQNEEIDRMQAWQKEWKQ